MLNVDDESDGECGTRVCHYGDVGASLQVALGMERTITATYVGCWFKVEPETLFELLNMSQIIWMDWSHCWF